MSRPLRIELAGGYYHVTSRGNEQKAIYTDAIDRWRFLRILSSVRERYCWRCLAWCLMDNHYHLVVQTMEPTLSAGKRQLNGLYAQRFNRRHRRVGHLFQGRFKASLIESDPYLAEVIRYTFLNPVRAGVVESLSAWKWSSWGSTVGISREPYWLPLDRGAVLGLFGSGEIEAVSRLERYLADCVGTDSRDIAPSPTGGSRAFVAARICEQTSTPSVEIPHIERVAEKAIHFQRPWSDDLFYAALAMGLSMREIASLAGCHYSTVSRRVARHERRLEGVACKT